MEICLRLPPPPYGILSVCELTPCTMLKANSEIHVLIVHCTRLHDIFYNNAITSRASPICTRSVSYFECSNDIRIHRRKKHIFSNCVIVALQACLLRHSKSYFLLHSLSYMTSSMTILTLRLSLNFLVYCMKDYICGFLKVSKWSMHSLAGKRHGS